MSFICSVPVVFLVVASIGVEPRLEEASVSVRHEHLTAHDEAIHGLEAHRHLELAILVERVYHIHVAVQIDASVLHEQQNAPIVTSVSIQVVIKLHTEGLTQRKSRNNEESNK